MSCFWKHQFGKWKVTKEATISRTATKAVIGELMVQKRTCELCNYTQVDKQETVLND